MHISLRFLLFHITFPSSIILKRTTESLIPKFQGQLSISEGKLTGREQQQPEGIRSSEFKIGTASKTRSQTSDKRMVCNPYSIQQGIRSNIRKKRSFQNSYEYEVLRNRAMHIITSPPSETVFNLGMQDALNKPPVMRCSAACEIF